MHLVLECSSLGNEAHVANRRLEPALILSWVELSLSSHTMVPNSAPTPIVIPIARAPQNVTRVAPRSIFAPPTRAASKPKHARKTREVPATTKIKLAAGTTAPTKRGMAAPPAKLAADASAA